MNDAITQLIELQQIDHQCGDLASRVRGLQAQKEQLRLRAEQERSMVNKLQEHLEKLQHDSRMMNLEVDNLDAQIRDYRHQLDTGIISFKEMEALRMKIGNQSTRMGEMEDDALHLMNEIEETVAQHQQETENLSVREADLDAEIAKIDTHVAQVQHDLAAWGKKREQLIAALPPHTVQQYEHLHAKFDNPVVRIENGTCSGCKLTVSGTTVERARDGMEIVTCENCSRIIYAR